jgi:hypothetical protein
LNARCRLWALSSCGLHEDGQIWTEARTCVSVFSSQQCEVVLIHTKLMRFSVDCSCIGNRSALVSMSFPHPTKYMDYFSHSELCISASPAVTALLMGHNTASYE